MLITRRDVARAMAILGGGMILPAATPSPMLAQTPVASPTTADPLALVDPELRPALDAMLQMMETMGAATPSPEQFQPEFLPEPAVTEEIIAGPAGAPDVLVYIINASPGTARPAILHTHGGGFVLGSAAWAIPPLQLQALALDCVIVSVEYRLAPETPFPGSLEDNYTALTWLHDHAAELGVDPARIALQGESAGGGHAAMLAIAARDRGVVPVVFQALIYPMLDDRTGSTRQPPAHIGAVVWRPEDNRNGWSALLGVPAGSETVPAGAVPGREADLAGLPPAWIGVGALDLFVEEDIEYARRLILAGVPTELLVTPGAYHGFDAFAPEAQMSQQFRLSYVNALARAFGQPPLAELEPLPSMFP